LREVANPASADTDDFTSQSSPGTSASDLAWATDNEEPSAKRQATDFMGEAGQLARM